MGALPPGVASRLRELPRELQEHTQRVREVARELASWHGVDSVPVDLAAAAHDLARAAEADVVLEEARRNGLKIYPVEERLPVLLHGAVAALWLERTEGVVDRRVLEAVRWHSTGRSCMGPVAKVVFLADKLDPYKIIRYPYLEEVRSLARKSLDQAILEFLNRELAYRLHEGYLIHPESLELRNELIAALG